MANVKVRGVGLTRQLLGAAEVVMSVADGTTVGGLLDQLAAEKGEAFARCAGNSQAASPYAPLRIVLNGRDLMPRQAPQAVLAEGDDLLIFLPIAGG
jgi:molybdopterin converting factor small subunit